MAEYERLSLAPILVEDFDTVFGRDFIRRHLHYVLVACVWSRVLSHCRHDPSIGREIKPPRNVVNSALKSGRLSVSERRQRHRGLKLQRDEDNDLPSLPTAPSF